MRDTVLIVGSHPKTRALVDFTRDVDIWVFNEAMSADWTVRADAVFQLHVEAIWRNPKNRNDPGHYLWLSSQTEIPVYMQEAYPDVPMSVKYPLDEVLSMLHGGDHYLTSSVTYAIALAILKGYKRIEIYGIAMETNTEYQYQRDGVAFWRGFAMGRGIEFAYADETYQSPMYGYEGEVSVPYEHFGARIEELKAPIEQLAEQYRAATVNTKAALDAFGRSGDQATQKALFETVGRQVELGKKLGELDGARQENMRYKDKADAMLGAAQAFVFSRQEFESAASDIRKKYEEAQTQFTAAGTILSVVHNNAEKAAKGSPKWAKLMESYHRQMQAYLQANNAAAVLRGAMMENYAVMDWLDKHIRAAGGAKSEAVLLEMANA